MYIYKKLFKRNNRIYWWTQDRANSRYSDITRENVKDKTDEYIAEIDNKTNIIKYEIKIDDDLVESIKRSLNLIN